MKTSEDQKAVKIMKHPGSRSNLFNLSHKSVAQIIHFPLFLFNIYIGLTLLLYFLSPMFVDANNGYWTIAYGCAALVFFTIGFKSAARSAMQSSGKSQTRPGMLNIFILIMCIINILYFFPLLMTSISYYGFTGINDMMSNVGENYHKKGALMEEIGNNSLGLFFTILNIFSISQVAPYTLVMFSREKINPIVLLVLILSTALNLAFYIAIGTMSGIFNLLVLLACGWLCKSFLFSLETSSSLLIASRKASFILLVMSMLGFLFFCFMVLSLASRMDRNLFFGVNIFYDQDSIVYILLGERLGNAFCLALFYLYSGWHGLGNSLALDFEWTEFRSFSRVFDSYMLRFLGENAEALSYPVRQESITGFPAYAYWHTIFPWFASDFTFIGTLLITLVMGAVYGWSWVKAIREGCLVSTSLFGLLTIGALFVNANSQILDNKPLTISLITLMVLMPFRQVISGIR